jgi:MFS transporter, PHS family, inorganic phosphate transporter
MLIILATILCLTTPTGTLSPDHCLIYLGMFRILLGIGVGGDYPMSASITSDRSNLRKRGTMLAYIFSNQGWGSFVGGIVFIVVLAAYRGVIEGKGEISKVDGGKLLLLFHFILFRRKTHHDSPVWRIVVGVSLVPACATLYQRLTLPESTRYIASQKLKSGEEGDAIAEFKQAQQGEQRDGEVNVEERTQTGSSFDDEDVAPEKLAADKAQFTGTLLGET